MAESAAQAGQQTGEAPLDAQAVVDGVIRDLLKDLSPTEAAYMAAVLAARSSAELHRLAKVQATAAKGSPDWGTWAALQNAGRKLVLDAAPAREGAAKLAGRPR